MVDSTHGVELPPSDSRLLTMIDGVKGSIGLAGSLTGLAVAT